MKQKNVISGGAVRRDSQTRKITKTETRVVKKSSNSKERKEVYNV